MVQLIVAKNRMGALGECRVRFEASTGLMVDCPGEILSDVKDVDRHQGGSLPPTPPSIVDGPLPF